MTIIPLPWTKPPLTLNTGLRAENPYSKAKKVRDAKAEAVAAIIAADLSPRCGCAGGGLVGDGAAFGAADPPADG